MSLKTTTAEGDSKPHFSEPYRLYTLDVFEYELDSSAALYGTIPVMLGHRKGATAGVFWFNPTETFVDVEQGTTHPLFCPRGGEGGGVSRGVGCVIGKGGEMVWFNPAKTFVDRGAKCDGSFRWNGGRGS